MDKTLVFALLALAIGVFVGGYVSESETISQPPAASAPAAAAAPPRSGVGSMPAASTAYDSQLAELRRRLDDETSARRSLEAGLRETREQVAALEQQLQDSRPLEAAPESEVLTSETNPARDQVWFDEQALLDGGVDAILATELKQIFEQLQLERLMLRDRSAREGWERGRLREELGVLAEREESLRDRLGEEAYDAYLYASGQSNRVSVTSVLESAQAAQAGIKPGDYILRYDGERVYNWRDLRTATRSGDLADTVEIEIDRDGESLQFYLARGPLGIRMNSRSVAP